MNLTQDLTTFIENVVKTSQSVQIDDVIIEGGAVRAIDEDRTVVLYQTNNVPSFPFDSIGLNRIGILLSRLDLVKGRDGFQIDIETKTNEDITHVSALKMKSADTKVGYLCANPETIKAPKQINDEIIYSIQLNAEAVSVLQKGHAAMGSENVSIISKDGVSFELEDINGDTFVHDFSSDATSLSPGADTSFVHKYPVKVILSLFKQNPDGVFEIGAKGILKISVNDLDFYVLPQI